MREDSAQHLAKPELRYHAGNSLPRAYPQLCISCSTTLKLPGSYIIAPWVIHYCSLGCIITIKKFPTSINFDRIKLPSCQQHCLRFYFVDIWGLTYELIRKYLMVTVNLVLYSYSLASKAS